MAWWDIIYGEIKMGDVLYTPGRGFNGGNMSKPFKVIGKDTSKITIYSGKSSIPLTKECFNSIEEAFQENADRWLRVASMHSNECFKNSADELIRNKTGSGLARGNYVCSILEHFGLVRYSMIVKKKVIILP